MWGRKAAARWVSVQYQRCRLTRTKSPQPHRSIILQKINSRELHQSKGGLLIMTLQISILCMHWISYICALMLIDSKFLLLIDSKFLQYFSQTIRNCNVIFEMRKLYWAIFAMRIFEMWFLLTVFEICFYLLITTAEWQHIVFNVYLDYNVWQFKCEQLPWCPAGVSI